MNLFDIFKKKQSQQAELTPNDSYLALDIGNESVKALVYKKTNGKIEILGFSKVKLSYDSMHSGFIKDLQSVMETCDIAIGEACEFLKDKDSLPNRTSVGIAGDIVLGEVINAEIIRKEPKNRISNLEIANIMSNVKLTTLEDVKEDLSEKYGIPIEDIEYIDLCTDSFFLNGRKLNSVLGQIGEKLILNTYLSFASHIHLESLRAVADFLELELHEIQAVPYSIYKSISTDKYNPNAIFIDIGAGTTDIAVYNNDTLYGTKMFSLAGQEFSQMIATDLSIPYDEAEELKLLYSIRNDKKELSTDERKVRKVCKEVAKNWVDALSLALRQLDDITNYPAKFYLSGGCSKLPEIKESLLEYPWKNMMNFDKFPSVEYLKPNMLLPFKDPLNFMNGVEDITVLSLALNAKNK